MTRLTDIVLANRRFLAFAWVVLLAAGAVLASGLADRLQPDDGPPAHGESLAVAAELARSGAPALYVVVTGTATRTTADGQFALARIVDAVTAAPGVRAITALPMPAPAAGAGAIKVLGVSTSDLSPQAPVTLARDLLSRGQLGPADSPTYLGGDAVQRAETASAEGQLGRTWIYGGLLALLLLLVTMGAFWATAMPVALGASAVVGGLGALAVASPPVPLSPGAPLLVALGAGMTVTTALAMLLAARMREQLGRGVQPRAALGQTMRTTGSAVLWTGATVALAAAALAWQWPDPLRGPALALALVVAAGTLSSLVMGPIMLQTLGFRLLRRTERQALVTRLVTAGPDARGNADEPDGGFWTRWGARLGAHAWVWVAASTIVLAALAVPAVLSGSQLSAAGEPPSASQSAQAARTASAAYGPGLLTPVQVVVTGQTAQAAAVAQALSGDPRVAHVVAPVQVAADRFLVSATTKATTSPAQARELVADLRDGPLRQTLGAVEARVGGSAAIDLDATEAVAVTFPSAAVAVLMVLFLGMLVTLRSVVVPLIAVGGLALSLAATAGALTYLSSHDSLAGVVGWSSGAATSALVACVVLAVLAVGTVLSMALVARMSERFGTSADSGDAVAYGVARTGRVLGGALLAALAGTVGLAVSPLPQAHAAGVAVAVALVVDAVLVRAVLLPATVRAVGWLAWVPRHSPAWSADLGTAAPVAASAPAATSSAGNPASQTT